MISRPPGPFTFARRYEVKASDGFQNLDKASYIFAVSGTGTSGVTVKSPILHAALNALSTPTAAIAGVYGVANGSLDTLQTDFVDADQSAYTTTQTETSYAAALTNVRSVNGAGAELTVTGTVGGGRFTPASIVVDEWGSGYVPGDILRLTCTGAAADPFNIDFTLTVDGLLTQAQYETTATNTGAGAYTTVFTELDGTQTAAVVEFDGTYATATSASPGVFRLTGLDITAGGIAVFQVGTEVKAASSAVSSAFTVFWRVPNNTFIADAGAVNFPVAVGEMIPIQVTSFKNMNTSDWVFTAVG